MKKIIDLLQKYPALSEFVKFCLVGFAYFLINTAVYAFLTRGMHLYYVTSSAIAFAIAVVWSFYANKKWTFGRYKNNQRNAVLYANFFIINTSGMVLGLVILYFLVNWLHAPDLFANVGVSVIVAILVFLINKFWVFTSSAQNIAYSKNEKKR